MYDFGTRDRRVGSVLDGALGTPFRSDASAVAPVLLET